MMASRIQLRRRPKGWRLPENTVVVSRPRPFSNPYRVVEDEHGLGWWCMVDRQNGFVFTTREAAQAQAVLLFREMVEASPELRAAIRAELAGRNLACWCRLCPAHREHGRPLGVACEACEPCHVDPLLEFANPLRCEAA